MDTILWMKRVPATSVGSQALFKLTDLIPWFIFNPFAVLYQEFALFGSRNFLLWDRGVVYLLSIGTLLSLQQGGRGARVVFQFCLDLFFFYIHSLMCSVSPVTCHRGICMTRCRTWARYEASLTKSPRHPVKSKTHLDKVTERKKKKNHEFGMQSRCNRYVTRAIARSRAPVSWDVSATCTEVGKNTSVVFSLHLSPHLW